MKAVNQIKLTLPSLSANEGFARVAVGAFVSQLDPTVDELADIKTAVSEAVTNSIVHAYPKGNGVVTLRCELLGDEVKIVVKDSGIGIADIAKAREPFYTTKPDEERSGMGFAVMESFMDKIEVVPNTKSGLVVTMYKRINSAIAKVENAW